RCERMHARRNPPSEKSGGKKKKKEGDRLLRFHTGSRDLAVTALIVKKNTRSGRASGDRVSEEMRGDLDLVANFASHDAVGPGDVKVLERDREIGREHHEVSGCALARLRIFGHVGKAEGDRDPLGHAM